MIRNTIEPGYWCICRVPKENDQGKCMNCGRWINYLDDDRR